MRIQIFAGKLDRSAGSHVYHREIARKLTDRGYDVSVIAFQSKHELPPSVRVVQFAFPEYSQMPVIWRCASIAKYLHCSRALTRLRTPQYPQVIIGGEHLWLKSCRRLLPTVPLIYLPHSLTVRDELDSYGLDGVQRLVTLPLYQNIQKWALRNASCILRFTRSGCEALDAEYPGVRSAPFEVNSVGIDIPSITAYRDRSGPVRLLMVGQLIHRKGIDISLKVLSEIRDSTWELSIVGDGPERGVLQELTASLNLTDKVQFLGHCDNPARWYAQSDLLLFPSRSESLGLVALEAMAHGTPCLAFRPDNNSFRTVTDEFVDHERTGLLANSVNEFAQMLRSAIEHVEHLKALGEEARLEVSRKYSWSAHLDRYESLFDRLLSRH